MINKITMFGISLKKRCILVFSFSLLALTLSGQDLKQSLAYGKADFQAGRYDDAIKTLQRVYFFGKGSYRQESALLLAGAYYASANFEQAFEYYDLSYNLLGNDSLRRECAYGRVRSRLGANDFEGALVSLNGVEASGDSLENQRWHFYYASIKFAIGSYEESKSAFLVATPNAANKDQIDLIFKKNAKIRRIHPKLARAMSMILPGSGQFYSGDIRNGLNSLLLTGILSGATLYMGLVYGIIDAGITVFPWLFRYYRGGFIGAEKIAWNRIARKRAALYADLMLIFEGP